MSVWSLKLLFPQRLNKYTSRIEGLKIEVMENLTYYIALLLIVIIGFFVVKKIAGCLLKSIVTIILIIVMIALWYFFLREGATLPTL